MQGAADGFISGMVSGAFAGAISGAIAAGPLGTAGQIVANAALNTASYCAGQLSSGGDITLGGLGVSAVMGGVSGNAGQTNYAASKAGIIGFTKSLAKEVASRNILVNAVAPGFVETDLTSNSSDKIREEMLSHISLGRFAQPEDVANVMLFLCSGLADYVSGQVIGVDGCEII